MLFPPEYRPSHTDDGRHTNPGLARLRPRPRCKQSNSQVQRRWTSLSSEPCAGSLGVKDRCAVTAQPRRSRSQSGPAQGGCGGGVNTGHHRGAGPEVSRYAQQLTASLPLPGHIRHPPRSLPPRDPHPRRLNRLWQCLPRVNPPCPLSLSPPPLLTNIPPPSEKQPATPAPSSPPSPPPTLSPSTSARPTPSPARPCTRPPTSTATRA